MYNVCMSMYVRIYIDVCMNIDVCMCVCMYVCMYVYRCMYVCRPISVILKLYTRVFTLDTVCVYNAHELLLSDTKQLLFN